MVPGAWNCPILELRGNSGGLRACPCGIGRALFTRGTGATRLPDTTRAGIKECVTTLSLNYLFITVCSVAATFIQHCKGQDDWQLQTWGSAQPKFLHYRTTSSSL